MSEDQLGLTRLVYRACGLPGPGCNPNDDSDSNPLRSLDVGSLTTALYFIATHLPGHRTTEKKRRIYSLGSLEVHELLSTAFQVFEHWPDNFYRFLDAKRRNPAPCAATAGLDKDFGTLYPGLYHHLKPSCFNFMRRAFEKYIRTSWDGGVVSARNTMLTSRRTHRSRFVGLCQAARELGCTIGLAATYLKSGFLKGTVRPRGKRRRMYLIELASLRRFIRVRGRIVSTDSAAKILGIKYKNVIALARQGVLPPFNSASRKGDTQYWFDKKKIENLLAVITRRIRKLPPDAKFEKIRFNEAAKQFGMLGESTPRIVKAVLCGEIFPRGMENGIGLTRYFFARADILAFSKQIRRERRDGALSVEEAAAAMGIRYPEVIQFVKGGFLSAKRTFVNGKPAHVVDKTSITQFNIDYVTNASLAREYRMGSRWMIRLILANGVSPVATRAVRELPYLWRRSEIESLDLHRIVGEYKGKRKPKRKRPTRLLGSSQAMKELGINRRKFDNLVKSCDLSPYRSDMKESGRGSKLRFTWFEVRRCKSRLACPSGVVTARHAARMLGEDLAWFYKKWVHTGRLKTVEFNDKLGKHFFRKADVDAAVAQKKSAVTGPQAAKIIGVHRTAIMKWTKAGKLVPISGPHIDGFGCNLYLRSEVQKIVEERAKQSALAA
ncbi:MAG: hypothetical protein WC899_07330 [bacterium]